MTNLVAALGALGVPAAIVVILQAVKAAGVALKRPVAATVFDPLAIVLGVVAAVGYQLHSGLSPDLTTAVAVGIALGTTATKLYDGLRGTFSLQVVEDAAPVAEAVLTAAEPSN